MKTTDAPLYSTHLVNPFDVLTKAEKSLIYSAHNFMAFKKNQYLFRSGEPVKGIYCIKKDAVKVTQNHGQRTITLRFVSTGEWVGHRSIFTSDNYQGTAKARLETQAYFISESLLLSLLIQNKTFAYQFIKKIIKDLVAAEKKLFESQELNVPSRLISLLHSLTDTFGIETQWGKKIPLNITKIEIADLVGASQEVVIRQLSQWKKEGLIKEDTKQITLSHQFLKKIIRR